MLNAKLLKRKLFTGNKVFAHKQAQLGQVCSGEVNLGSKTTIFLFCFFITVFSYLIFGIFYRMNFVARRKMYTKVCEVMTKIVL